MTAQTHFIEPLDVLILRGNKLFGDPGSYAESIVPPWPSVAAGALRSALLAHKGVDFAAFSSGRHVDDELGTPKDPGPFVLTAFHLARCVGSNHSPEPLFQPPADLVIRKQESTAAKEPGEGRQSPSNKKPGKKTGGEFDPGDFCVERLRPHEPPTGIACSRNTRMLAVLPEAKRGKPESGFWLSLASWRKYLAGDAVESADLVRAADLWRAETRVGVGLDAKRRRASDGALFSVQAVSLNKSEHRGNCGAAGHRSNSAAAVGFLAQSTGANFPDQFAMRLGGDGRAAMARRVEAEPRGVDFGLAQADLDQICEVRRCRLVLTTPGIFARGWLPTGVSESNSELDFQLHGVGGKLVCAAVPRAETVSGFDIAKGLPKTARRVAPAGSVYWLEELNATPDALRKLAAKGFWSERVEDPMRRAEGFNRLAIAAY